MRRRKEFDEYLYSAGKMPQGGWCKPPAKPVVITVDFCNKNYRVLTRQFLLSNFATRLFERTARKVLF